jgi:predicted nucleic acid-binding protein
VIFVDTSFRFAPRRRRDPQHDIAHDIIERSSRIRVEHVGERVERQALVWLRQQNDREFSFVDATSLTSAWAVATRSRCGCREGRAQGSVANP